MMKLFHRQGASSYLYLVIILGVISFAIFGFIRFELRLNEVARLEVQAKQTRLLSELAFDNAQSFLDDVVIKKRTLVFSKQLGDESEISATAEKLKNDWVRLECLGKKGDASHLLIAYYIYAKDFFLDSKDFREKMSVEVIDRNKQTLNSTLLKQKKPLLLIIDKSVNQLSFGQNMLLREGDLVIVPSESKMTPIQLVIKRALTIKGDFEALGSLKLLEDMECYGKVIVHGDLVFNEGTKLTATEGIYLSGKVRLGDEVLEKENYSTYIDGELKTYDHEYKKSKLYFLGLAPNR